MADASATILLPRSASPRAPVELTQETRARRLDMQILGRLGEARLPKAPDLSVESLV